ncbi:MAG: UDP-N-acetylglucosamine--N-acetylmuramyl-(pentapeptide) pyrophosphoryl-undecaprenol N-acetylglucosamine transferase, partial [Pyrinomonadaceae bacterium]|nr:UDP-N-acetylglucosamine--N-acetylmuramyl-(pentapeptide) pyrophosphoryl-undecaprenol N-acetylglucosamine transferase [Phycisphaerales bacterium]
ARELTRLTDGSARSLFVCSDRPLDAEILSKESLEFVPLAARPISLKPRGMVRFLGAWGKSVRESRTLIRSEMERLQTSPEHRRAGGGGGMTPAGHLLPVTRGVSSTENVHVVAMGGFVAAPFVQAARVEHVGVTLVNLDAIPGKANRLIARHADRIFTAAAIAPGAVPEAKLARWHAIPPIVRPQALPPRLGPSSDGSVSSSTMMGKDECRKALGLDPSTPTLLVTGGSQGARSINQLLLALVDAEGASIGATASRPSLRGRSGGLGGGADTRWQVLHQCGKDDVEVLRRAYQHAGVSAIVEPFVTAMGLWWGAADLAISRAGAGSVAEAWANHVPAIFLPYPYHRDLHQKHNARVLVESGGAILAYDTLDAKQTLADMTPALKELLNSPARRQAMQTALTRLGPASGAEQIAKALLQGVTH